MVALCCVLLWLTGNQHVFYGIGKTYFIGKSKPDIDDLPFFSVSTMTKGNPEPWLLSSSFNSGTLRLEHSEYLDSLETCAFLVFRNDSLLFEKYWRDYTDSTMSNSFSMAKSFVGMLIGIAVDEGYIESLDQKVGDFLPEFSEGLNAKLTIRNLLQMSSGIPFGESYSSPFGFMAKAYYGKQLEEETMKFKVESEPGSMWIYEGGNSVLLGLILKKATGKTPSLYFQEKIWSCIGAEHNAHWNLDHEGGLEKTFSGFYATARDYARIGKLFEHDGVWNADTLIQPGFVEEALTPCYIPDPKGEKCFWYGYHWWLGTHNDDFFFSCRGLRGQYIAVIPSQKIIVVRLGHNHSSTTNNRVSEDLRLCLDAARDIASQ